MKRKWERETSEEGREGQPRKTENELPIATFILTLTLNLTLKEETKGKKT